MFELASMEKLKNTVYIAAFSRVWGDKGLGNIVNMSFGTVLWRHMATNV